MGRDEIKTDFLRHAHTTLRVGVWDSKSFPETESWKVALDFIAPRMKLSRFMVADFMPWLWCRHCNDHKPTETAMYRCVGGGGRSER